MAAYLSRRAPSLAGLAPILLLLLLLPAAAPAQAAGGPPATGGHARDAGADDSQPAVLYVVQPGDTLTGIARHFATRVAALQLANGMGERTLILIGQRLIIPVLPPAPAPVDPPD